MKRPATVHPDPAESVRRVLEDVMARREAGETVPDAGVIAANPGLMPLLGEELALLSMLERARQASMDGGSRGRGARLDQSIEPLAETAFEGFQIVGEVHQGGQGVVYEAVQRSTGRRVAIKVMRQGLFGDRGDTARFEREVRILGQLDHPGVVGIVATGVHTGHFYFVMDFVQGLPLDQHAAEHCRSIDERLQLFLRVCEAVECAHLRGIIHRDLKPANVLVDERGQPRILDFGLARMAAESVAASRNTHTGQFVGSMPWASPEQAGGDPTKIDTRTDVYSLGVMLYQLLTGRFPYRVEGGPRDVLDRILTAAPVRPRSVARGIDEELELIVLKCLAKERERRYQSVGELGEDLRRYRDGRPLLARPPSAAYAARAFVRRHKALVAGAGAVAATLLLGLVGTILGLTEASAGRRSAENALELAHKAQDTAEHRLAEAQHLAYAASIAAADSALRADDVATARTRLAAAPPALREWEWAYLSARLDQSAGAVDAPPIIAGAVSDDGRALAMITAEGSIRVVSVPSNKIVWEARVPDPLRSSTEQTVALSHDATMLASAHGDHLLVWRLDNPGPVADVTFPNPGWGYITAAFSPDNRRIAANGRVGRMILYDVDSRDVRPFEPKLWYAGVAWTPDGRRLIAASTRGPMAFDASAEDTGTQLRPEAPTQGAPAGFLRISPDGALLATGLGTDVLLTSISDGNSTTVLHGHTQQPAAAAFSSDGRRLATAGWDRTVRIWDVKGAQQESVLLGHSAAVTALGFLAGDERLVSFARDGSAKVWDLTLPKSEVSLGIGGSGVQSVTLSQDGRRALTSSVHDTRLWRLDAGGFTPLSSFAQAGSGFSAIAPDGHSAAVSGPGTSLELVDVDSHRTLWQSDGHASPAMHIAFSPDGRLIATTSADGTVRLWDAATGSPLRTFRHGLFITPSVCFSVDSRWLAAPTGSDPAIWDCAGGAEVLRVHLDHSIEANVVTISPDGTLLATGLSDGTVVLWEIPTGRRVRTLSGMGPEVWSLAFNPSGTRLAAGSKDRTIRLWDPATGEELLALRGHTGTVLSMAWTRDGQALVSAGVDEKLRLWRAGEAR